MLPPEHRYRELGSLGEGAFGKVVKAEDVETKEIVAIKRMERRCLGSAARLEAEVLNHAILDHYHVIKFREVFLTEEHFNIVMDYADGGSLRDYMHARQAEERERRRDPHFVFKFEEELARRLFQQIVLALDYCHEKGVVNRDLKLNNTLLQWVPSAQTYIVKLCDFGYSKHDSRSAARSRVGTFTYMAPEVLLSNNAIPYEGKHADMFSCGVLLYLMLCGVRAYPFGCVREGASMAKDIHAMVAKIRAREYVQPEGVSDECRAVIAGLLEPDPKRRLSLAQLVEHAWFRRALPAGALDMTKALLQRDAARGWPAAQREADVRAVVRDAPLGV